MTDPFVVMKKRTRTAFTTIAAAVLLYVGSYAALSWQGEYVPEAWGLGWVKDYTWAPYGFVSGQYGVEWHRLPRLVFLPLWVCDTRLVHTWDKAHDGKYPINTALNTVLQKRLEQYEKTQSGVK